MFQSCVLFLSMIFGAVGCFNLVNFDFWGWRSRSIYFFTLRSVWHSSQFGHTWSVKMREIFPPTWMFASNVQVKGQPNTDYEHMVLVDYYTLLYMLPSLLRDDSSTYCHTVCPYRSSIYCSTCTEYWVLRYSVCRKISGFCLHIAHACVLCVLEYCMLHTSNRYQNGVPAHGVPIRRRISCCVVIMSSLKGTDGLDSCSSVPPLSQSGETFDAHRVLVVLGE
jgi:hypothetical protein